MSRDSKGGRRLSSSPTASPTGSHDFHLDDTITFSGTEQSRSSIDDAVIDEILRSISDQSDTPVPHTSTRTARQAAPSGGTVSQSTRTDRPYMTADNSYAAAARAHHADDTQRVSSPQPVRPTTGPVPDPSYYSMRDPAQTLSFQPARPAHRDTDRLPTLVEEKPVRRKSAVGKVLTFIVLILVVVAIVLGVRMVYILGPSMGWDLPDLSQLPGISTLTGMLPEENPGETVGTPPADGTDADQPQDLGEIPSSVTLDQENLNLEQGSMAILTATLDTDWKGTIVWETSDADVATVTSIGDNIAQVDYVGEGTCSIVAMAAAGLEDNPHASCWVVCGPAGEGQETEEPTNTDAPEEGTGDTTAEHVDITLNREDFTLGVGERHQLMDENADQVTWTSSDEAVATVSESGIVTAVAPGSCTITATGPDGATSSAIARVKS